MMLLNDRTEVAKPGFDLLKLIIIAAAASGKNIIQSQNTINDRLEVPITYT